MCSCARFRPVRSDAAPSSHPGPRVPRVACACSCSPAGFAQDLPGHRLGRARQVRGCVLRALRPPPSFAPGSCLPLGCTWDPRTPARTATALCANATEGPVAHSAVRAAGYLVNSSNGLMVAAFEDPARAIRWALSTMANSLKADWDTDLLDHELGGENLNVSYLFSLGEKGQPTARSLGSRPRARARGCSGARGGLCAGCGARALLAVPATPPPAQRRWWWATTAWRTCWS